MQMNPHNVATQRCVGSHPNCWICAKPGILIVDRRTADLRASPQFSFGAHFAADERAPEAQWLSHYRSVVKNIKLKNQKKKYTTLGLTPQAIGRGMCIFFSNFHQIYRSIAIVAPIISSL